MKPNLLLDIDGVLCDFFLGFGAFLNDNYGTTLDLGRDPASYYLKEWDDSCANLDINSILEKWINHGGFAKAPVYQGAQEFVKNLNDLANVSVVTARVGDFEKRFGLKTIEKIKQDTYEWFKNNNFNVQQVYFDHNKVDFCKEGDISVLIEDKLSTALEATKSGIDAILINRGWNQCLERYRIYRVNSYQNALDWVKKLT